jgi:hypothetical protein
MDRLEFAIAIKNEVSGPARDAKASLAAMRAELSAVDSRIRELDRANKLMSIGGKQFSDQIKRNRNELVLLRVRAADLKDGIKAIAPPSRSAAGGLRDLAAAGGVWGAVASRAIDIVQGLADRIRDVAVASAHLVATLIVEGGRWAIEAGAAREKAEATYALFAGSAEKGREIFERVDALGAAIHVPTEKAHEYARDLLAAGIEGTHRLEQAVKSIAMLQRVGGDAASAKIQSIMTRAAESQRTMPWTGGRGVFSVSREDLIGTGVSIDEVYDALARRMTRSNAEIRSLMLAGQISASDGIDALNDVLERGKVGAAAREMVGGIEEPIREIRDNIGKLLRDVDYKGFMREVSGIPRLFDPATDSGRAMKSVLTSVFSSVFDAGTKMVRGLKIAFLELSIAGVQLLIRFAPIIIALREQWQRLKDNQIVALGLSFALDRLSMAADAVVVAMEGIGRQIVVVMQALNALDDAARYVSDVVADELHFAKRLDMRAIGQALMVDFMGGMTGGGIATAIGEAIGSQLKRGFRDAIGWHSPPQFFLEGGEASADAFAQGARDMGFAAGAMAKSLPAMSPTRGGGITIHATMPIHIDGAQSPSAVVDEFESRATAWLQRLAIDLTGGEGSAA